MTEKQINKSLKEKAISIKGKEYVQVKDRVMFLSDNYEWRYNLQSEYQYFPERKMWVVKATLTIWNEDHTEFSIYNWLAQEVESDNYKEVNYSSALENCETSARGRCCAAAGIGIDATWGIASANEMQKALNRSKPVDTKDWPFTDDNGVPWEPEWFTKAKQSTKFMQECLDEEDFISKIKNKYKPNKQQETDLRICYKNAKAMENIDLPFGD